MSDLQYSVDGAVATILLNRPHRKNAFTLEMVDEWAAALKSAAADDRVRVVVVTGAGDAFCSGVDLDAFKGETRGPLQEKELLTDRVHQVAHAMAALPKPVIAVVRGVAVGAGMDMSLMCDIRLAGRSARFSEGYIRVGLVPGDGGCYYLPRIIGVANALRLLWTGEFVDADRALALGLVSEVHDDESVLGEAYALAETIAARAPIAVEVIKRSVYQGLDQSLTSALDSISSHQAVVLSTQDSAEAFAAFTERRDPVFQRR
ncbi:enoyl-CoA hydratase/isomerase family protein [Rhodococcus opacus]|uniref:enoyl-CoA hydratase/isomerase family protein n=1 Tax=Rhodococcus opacus TaxID=37919 RepID=UPI0024735016|nr:enoyl-CoA hydratase-related protein [Rhodococcus opacus]MDH6291273.1 enoyl-CoA hydratase/carnithine racemase [Rhodococcus opacus]